MPENITARLWMTGEKGRQIYKVDAPATTLNKGLTPGNVSMPPSVTPTLIVVRKIIMQKLIRLFQFMKPIKAILLTLNKLRLCQLGTVQE